MTINIKPCPHHKRYNPFHIPVTSGAEIKGGCPHCTRMREMAVLMKDAGLLMPKPDRERKAA